MAVLLGVFMLGLLLAVPPLREVLRAIDHMNPGWIGVGIALELASCASFVVVFRLFFAPLLLARLAGSRGPSWPPAYCYRPAASAGLPSAAG